LSWIIDAVRDEILKRRNEIQPLLDQGRNLRAYEELNRIAAEAGAKFNVGVLLNYPIKSQVRELETVALRNVSIFVDKARKDFTGKDEDQIKERVRQILPESTFAPIDSKHKGFHADLNSGRITVLPGAVHLWCVIDDGVRSFLDWLFVEVYDQKR